MVQAMSPPVRTGIAGLERALLVVVFVFAAGIAIVVHINTGGVWNDWVAPSAVLSLLGLGIGFILLSWQLEVQHKNTLEAHRQQAESRLRLELYDKIAQRMEAAKGSLAEITSEPTSYVMRLKVVHETKSELWEVPEDFFPSHNVRELQNEVSRKIIDLISILETYEIALDGFTTFRAELGKKLQALKSLTEIFVFNAMKFKRDSPAVFDWPPSDHDFDSLSDSARAIMQASIDLSRVIEDLRRDALNHLIGPLFPGRQLEPRNS